MEELVERAKNEDSEAFTNLILNIERDLYCIARSKYAEFYKKYDGLLNKHEKVSIGWIPKINGLYSLIFENYKYENAVFYKVDNHVRKVWEVTIYYDYYKYTKDFPERFVYYVDATTGEIIGGDIFYGAKMQLKNLMDDPYNVIEK